MFTTVGFSGQCIWLENSLAFIYSGYFVNIFIEIPAETPVLVILLPLFYQSKSRIDKTLNTYCVTNLQYSSYQFKILVL